MSLKPEILARLKDFQAWKAEREDFDLLDYVGCVATPDLFFGFLALLVPELVLHEGNYFLASHFESATYEEWKKKLEDPVAVQKVMNHLHISSLFQEQEVSNEVAETVARLLADTWSRVFADKGLVGHASGSGFEDVQVTLFRRAVK